MSIQYTYQIIKVDPQARVMEIVYNSEGRQPVHVGARLPYAGESVEAVVQMYSPVAYWLEREAEVIIPQVGAGGQIVPGESVNGVPVIPSAVTMRQARLALSAIGLLTQVDAAINALPEPQKTAAKIEWEFSSVVERNRPFVQQLGASLGLTPTQLDNLFIEASKL